MARALTLLGQWVATTRKRAADIGGLHATPAAREAHLRQALVALSSTLDAAEPGLGLRALDALYPGVFAGLVGDLDAALVQRTARRLHVAYEAPLSEQAAQQMQARGLVGGA